MLKTKKNQHNTAQNDKAFYYDDNSQADLKLAILCEGEYNTVGDYLSVKNLYTNDTNEYNFGTIRENYSSYIGDLTAFLDTTSSIVGDITAVGLCYPNVSYSLGLFSSTSIVDAEGNPISVTKDKTNTVTVTGRFYLDITFPNSEDVGTNIIKFFPPQCSRLNNLNHILQDSYFYDNYKNYQRISPFGFNRIVLDYSGIELSKEELKSGFLKNGYPLLSYGAAKLVKYNNLLSSPNTSYDITELTHSASSDQYTGYIKSIIFNEYAIIQFPNYEICPKYIYYNYNYGTGNGIKNHFVTFLNIINANNSTLKLNETSQSSGFNFVNLDITKSPLYNKGQYIFIDGMQYDEDNTKTWLYHNVVTASKIIPIEEVDYLWQRKSQKTNSGKVSRTIINNSIFNLQMCDKTYTYTYDTEWFVKMGYNYALYISALGVGIGYQIVSNSQSDTAIETAFNDYYAGSGSYHQFYAEKGLNMIYNSKENYFLSDKDERNFSYTKEIPFFSTGEKIDIDHIFFQFKTVRPICIKIYVTNSEPEEINTNHDYKVIKLLKQFDYFNKGENHINTYYFYKTILGMSFL